MATSASIWLSLSTNPFEEKSISKPCGLVFRNVFDKKKTSPALVMRKVGLNLHSLPGKANGHGTYSPPLITTKSFK